MGRISLLVGLWLVSPSFSDLADKSFEFCQPVVDCSLLVGWPIYSVESGYT
jgi:hypothetical protein